MRFLSMYLILSTGRIVLLCSTEIYFNRVNVKVSNKSLIVAYLKVPRNSCPSLKSLPWNITDHAETEDRDINSDLICQKPICTQLLVHACNFPPTTLWTMNYHYKNIWNNMLFWNRIVVLGSVAKEYLHCSQHNGSRLKVNTCFCVTWN